MNIPFHPLLSYRILLDIYLHREGYGSAVPTRYDLSAMHMIHDYSFVCLARMHCVVEFLLN